jgi:hypothetical protein
LLLIKNYWSQQPTQNIECHHQFIVLLVVLIISFIFNCLGFSLSVYFEKKKARLFYQAGFCIFLLLSKIYQFSSQQHKTPLVMANATKNFVLFVL